MCVNVSVCVCVCVCVCEGVMTLAVNQLFRPTPTRHVDDLFPLHKMHDNNLGKVNSLQKYITYWKYFEKRTTRCVGHDCERALFSLIARLYSMNYGY